MLDGGIAFKDQTHIHYKCALFSLPGIDSFFFFFGSLVYTRVHEM